LTALINRQERDVPTIEIQGRSIAYECPEPFDRGQGRQLLFVHGASFNRRVWREQMAHFARAATPVCLDLAGHGQSSGPICDPVEDHCAIVKAFADSIGLGNFVLVGHSMGGAIAQNYVARYPKDVVALVLVSTSPRFSIRGERLNEWSEAPEKYRKDELDVILAPVTGSEVRQRLQAMRDENPWEVQRADLIACSRWDNAVGFPAIRHPTLLLTAKYDPILEGNRAMHRLLPQSVLVELERSGHMIMVEEPEAVNRAIEDFVQALPLGRRPVR
jgi:pimeloyl-ACP methyl ester carboxylesterase